MLCDPTTTEHDLTSCRHVAAQVMSVDSEQRRVLVEIGEPEGNLLSAWLPYLESGTGSPAEGDTVLTTGPTGYVIGILSRGQNAHRPHTEPAVPLSDGTHVQVVRAEDGDRVRLTDVDGRVLFEYSTRDGHIAINAPSGDLDCTAKGNIAFKAGGDLLLSGSSVNVAARSGIRLSVPNAVRRTLSAMYLTPRGWLVRSGRVEVESDHASLRIGEADFEGGRVSARVELVNLMVDRVKTTADCVVTTAKNVYQRVHALAQIRAGRTRTIVDGTAHTTAKRSIYWTEEDCKILGDKIHIG